MSDRSIVEKNCNTLLKAYRTELLPYVTDNWTNLPEDAKESMCRVNSFFCGLHYLVGLAEQAQQCLATWEKSQIEQYKNDKSQSGTVSLIRTTCKALGAHCSEQAGNHVQFKAYLESKGINTIPLARFVGNRFNVLFHNAAGVYFLNEQIRQFYDTAFGTPNLLHVAVRKSIGEEEYVVACRVLGLVDKLITGPLWRELESTTSTIADMSRVYEQLCDSFDKWKDDATDLLDGSARPFSGAIVSVDDVS